MKRKNSDMAPFYLAAVILALCLLPGAAFAEYDWPYVVRQALSAYPKDSEGLKTILNHAEKEGVAAEGVAIILSRSASASIPAGDFGAFVERLTVAGREGLPVHPLIEKVLEGLSKNIPSGRILPVLDRKIETYHKAQTIAGKDSGGGALELVTLTIERGVPPSLLRDLFKASRPDAAVIGHSALALADLRDFGFSDAQGLRIVRAGIAAGYFTRGDPAFLSQISLAVKAGRSKNEIADAVERGLRRGEPMSGVLQRLPGGSSPGFSGRGGTMPGMDGSAGGKGGGTRNGGAGPKGGRR